MPTYQPATGYWLQPSVSPRHRLGGRLAGHDVECPNCRKPLLLLLDLDPRDPRLELPPGNVDRLPVLFCWTCPLGHEDFSYRVGVGIELLTFARGGCEAEFPYPNYPRAFPPVGLELVPLTSEEQHTLHRLNSEPERSRILQAFPHLDRPRHQVGGEPYLLQDLRPKPCPGCGEAMPLFASLGDDTFSPHPFTGNPWVQTLVHLCRPCHVVVVYQQCD